MRHLLISGTGATHTAALIAYKKLSWNLGSYIFPLHKLGLVNPEHSIERLIKNLEAKGPANLIGHSQGGLVAAVVATRRPDLVNTTITLAAPLKGTLLAVGPLSAVRAMAPFSALCKELRGTERMHNIVGTRDALILPYESGLLAGAHHYEFPVGHLRLIRDDAVVRLCGRILMGLPTGSRILSYSDPRNDIYVGDISERVA